MIIIIKTYSCDNCGYRQPFDPKDNLDHFNGMVPIDKCPACWLGKNPTETKQDMPLTLEKDKNRRTRITIMPESGIDNLLFVIGGKRKHNKKLPAFIHKSSVKDVNVETRKLTTDEKNLIQKHIRNKVIYFKKLEDNS